VSPTKQARSDNGKETKTLSVTEWRKKPWEKAGSVGGPVPLWPDEQAVCKRDLTCKEVS